MVVPIMLLVVVLAGVAAGYLVGASNSNANHVVTEYTTTTYTSVLNNEVFLMKVNGSTYWADDVSKDTVVQNPGYGYFLNGSVTFDVVKFTTICPSGYSGCPGSAGNSTALTLGVVSFKMAFPDKSTESLGDVIGTSIYAFALSQHTPKAGMLIEYVNDYPHNSVGYAVFLLVSSCCSPPYLS